MARILVIAGHTDGPCFIRRALAGEGHHTTVLTQIRTAMDHIQGHAPDLVLIDRLTSGFDCFEALLAIKTQFSRGANGVWQIGSQYKRPFGARW